MEFCKKSLRKYSKRNINSASVDEKFVKKVLRDVCLGLEVMHSKGIVHLDIKPENILESFSGRFKIADFGLTRSLMQMNEDRDIPEGDCRYLAKELWNDDPFSPLPDLTKADIFSLGMTAYELI